MCNKVAVLSPQFKFGTENANKVEAVSVGVGGLFITSVKISNNIKKECVLLYKRYKAPEIHQWSLLGGHVDMYNTCEDTLKKKIRAIMKDRIQERDIEVLDIVTAVNHFDKQQKYHYVSPQYYVSIKKSSFEKIPTTNDITKDSDAIVILSTVTKLKNSMGSKYEKYSTKDKPLLSLVPIDVIKELEVTDLENIFIHTTVEAILQHCSLFDNIKKIEAVTQTYKNWRNKKDME